MLVANIAQLRSHNEELASLRATNEQKQAEIAVLQAVEAEAQAETVRLGAVNDHAEAELARLHDIIAALHRHRFGARSEKLADKQLEMAFEDTETALAVVAASLDAVAPAPREPRWRKINRGRLPAHLQRVEQVVDIETRRAAAAVVLCTSSQRTSPSSSTWCPQPFVSSSPAARAIVAVNARGPS